MAVSPFEEELKEVLGKVFVSRGNLDDFTSYELDTHLADITRDDTLSEMNKAVLRWCAARGKTEKLIQSVMKVSDREDVQKTCASILLRMAQVQTAPEIAPVSGSSIPQFISPRELTITVEGLTKRHWVRTDPKASNDYEATVDDLTIKTVQLLQRWHNASSGLLEGELKILGTHLFNILFAPSSKTEEKDAKKPTVTHVLWGQCEPDKDKLHERADAPLRVVLSFAPDARDLALLPWECLYVPKSVIQFDDGEKWPEEGFFLTNAREKEITLTRTPLKIKGGNPSSPPLSILVVNAQNAYGVREKGAKGKEGTFPLGQLEGPGTKIRSKVLDNPAWEDFENVLAGAKSTPNETFHVIHFVGHGKIENDQQWLALRPLAEKESWIEMIRVWDIIRGCEPRLVFLHAVCDHKGSYMAFVQAAAFLLSRGCPAVVVIEHCGRTRNFTKEFYRLLSEGHYIDFALRAGRRQLGEYRGEFSNPVLFLQLLSSIVGPGEGGAKSSAERETEIPQVPESQTLSPGTLEKKQPLEQKTLVPQQVSGPPELHSPSTLGEKLPS